MQAYPGHRQHKLDLTSPETIDNGAPKPCWGACYFKPYDHGSDAYPKAKKLNSKQSCKQAKIYSHLLKLLYNKMALLTFPATKKVYTKYRKTKYNRRLLIQLYINIYLNIINLNYIFFFTMCISHLFPPRIKNPA
jgi:hypothetical protein